MFQVICEAYHLMKDCLGMTPPEIGKVMEEWNKTELDSYLIEISAAILQFQDDKGDYLVEKIRDAAGQKGTGKWTAINSLDFGVPVTLIAESVFARCLSAIKNDRVEASKLLKGPDCCKKVIGDKAAFVEDIRNALYASKIVSYAQGFMLMKEAAKEYRWELNYGSIAMMWRGGCIIRSRFLGNIREAFVKNKELTSLLLDDFFRDAVHKSQASWRRVVSKSVEFGVPVPCFSSALAFYDGFRSERLPANLIQAQRDYFGAHTYELLSSPGQFHHTDWTGRGGRVSSTTYQA